MRWVLGIFALVYWLSYSIWWNRNGLALATGLPLHICGLNGRAQPAPCCDKRGINNAQMQTVKK